MKLNILALFSISIFFAPTVFAENTEPLPSPRHAQNLSELPPLFKNKYGHSHFREGMSGIYQIDRLGTNLPNGLSAQDIVRLIAPNEDLKLAFVVGAKALPYRLNNYVVIACFAQSKEEYQREIRYRNDFGKSCEKEGYSSNDSIYLGLIEYDPLKPKPKLVAKSLEIATDWSFLDSSQFRLKSKSRGFIPNGIYREFDFAQFKVSDTQTAFGLRVGINVGYAGGNGYFEVLSLFMVDSDRIVNIFAEPIYFYQNLAGAWNKNGTRQHALIEAENVLVVLPSQTDGYYDLQIKSLDSDWQRIFSWNAFQKRYLPVDVPVTSPEVLQLINKTEHFTKKSTEQAFQEVQKAIKLIARPNG